MNNKGFTLIESVSMLIIISGMTLISTPLIVKQLNEVKKEETIDTCYYIKQSLKAYYYNDGQNKTFDLANNEIKKELDIENVDVEGNATIDSNGNVTSNLKFKDFTCTITGNTEEISCS